MWFLFAFLAFLMVSYFCWLVLIETVLLRIYGLLHSVYCYGLLLQTSSSNLIDGGAVDLVEKPMGGLSSRNLIKEY